MANNSVKFKEPKNPLDPIVVFDPSFEFSNIIMPLSDHDAGVPNPQDIQLNKLALDGIQTPLVKLNNKVLFINNIYSLIIKLRYFLPEIEIVVGDDNQNIQATDVPGMNNVITVIMTAPVDGANKKISLDFYITKCKFNDDNTITYIGELKTNGLKQVKYLQLGDGPLSTYGMLEAIAKDCKLGFAVSEKCKDIDDKRWRQIYSQTYKQFINNEIEHSGLDEDSIFDCWIDNFGYLVMVNVSHILNEKCELEQLSTKVITGSVNPTISEDELPKQQVDEVYRVITNSHDYTGTANLHISDYHSIVNNDKILNNGTLNKYFYLDGPCDTNTISQEQVQIIENSVDGREDSESYQFENIEFIGINQEEDDECDAIKIVQKQIVKNYFNKIYAKMLNVTMDVPNYSLQRGMLIGVVIEEYDPQNKQAILNSGTNAFATDKDDDDSAEISDTNTRNILIDDELGLMNPALSGIYYIKEIEFNYNNGMDKIVQTLTLVKKGLLSNIQNKYTAKKQVK